MLEDPVTGGGAGLLNTSIKSEGGLSGKGDYEDDTGIADRTFDQTEAAAPPSGEGQLAFDADSIKVMGESVNVSGLPEEVAKETEYSPAT